MMLIAQSVTVALNHLLAREVWARERLACYAGRSIYVSTPLLAVMMTVQADGLVAPLVNRANRADRASDSAFDVSLTLSTGILSTWLTQGWTAETKQVKLEGDAEFAQTLSLLAQSLRWEVEEDLARLIGDAPAYHLMKTA